MLTVEFNGHSDSDQQLMMQLMLENGFENRMNMTSDERTVDDWFFNKKGFKSDIKLKNVHYTSGPYFANPVIA